ncbi:glycoside hydrolase family 16 protein [Granulicella cerasi]|uniref:Glycoside hydrolase family 16 protein n=1 Tax=Granulicella cerasi TaxID=741063 RepID=A0ABW1Z9R3_9BACT|nr:glycoside hydrolase family 16 protein [Granulicella cerasi]
MKHKWFAVALLFALSAPGWTQAAKPHWKLTWSDEFNGPDGSAPDPAKWSFVVDGKGFGNQELEYYTDRAVNTHVEHGNLVITALKEDFTGKDGVLRHYTSGRIETKGKFAQQYGRFEARIKFPRGKGVWPAFWMLGDDIEKVGWPKSGELDIVENIGREPSKIHGSLHGPGYSGGSPLTGAYTLPDGKIFADDFHVFAVEWDPKEIRFYCDGHLYETETTDSIPEAKHWAFDHPFFILLNFAVGGGWPGNPDETTQFPQQMLVDWVRVYKAQ